MQLNVKSLFDQVAITYKGTRERKNLDNRTRKLSVVLPSPPPSLPVFRTDCGSHFPFLTEKHIIEKESSATHSNRAKSSKSEREKQYVFHTCLIISKAGEHCVKDGVCELPVFLGEF